MSEKFINVTGKDNIIQLGIHYIYEHTGYESIVELEGETIPAGSGNEYTSKDYLMFPIIGMARQLGTLKVFNHKQGLAAEAEMLVKTAANAGPRTDLCGTGADQTGGAAGTYEEQYAAQYFS